MTHRVENIAVAWDMAHAEAAAIDNVTMQKFAGAKALEGDKAGESANKDQYISKIAEIYLAEHTPLEYLEELRKVPATKRAGKRSENARRWFEKWTSYHTDALIAKEPTLYDEVEALTDGVGVYDSLSRNVHGLVIAAYGAHRWQSGTMPSPIKIPKEYWHDVLTPLYQEWATYMTIALNAGLTIDDQARRTLCYRSVKVLQELLTDRSTDTRELIPDHTVVKMFEETSYASDLKQIYSEALVVAESHNAARMQTKIREREAEAMPTEVREQMLFASQNAAVLNFIAKRTVGNTVRLDSITDVPRVVGAQVGVIAQELSTTEQKSLKYFSFRGVKKDPGAIMRPKGFYGAFKNVQLMHLPIDLEFTEEFNRPFDTPDKYRVLARFVISVDMHSTGRGKIGESNQEVVIADTDRRKTKQLLTSVRKSDLGQADVARLRQNAQGVNRIITASAMINAVAGGLPGNGKRR